jgi:hypothetical protein
MSTVKYLHSGMTGAPVMNNVAGALIGVLDACLVNGWGSATVDSVSVTAGVATVTRAAGHPFEIDQITEISGATPAGLNGQKIVLSTTPTTYTFDATGVAPGAATGTILHKIAALGWTKPFSGTNLASYLQGSGSGHYMDVIDTAATTSVIRGYVNMTAVGVGTGDFPNVASAGNPFWNKAVDSGARPWTLIGDSAGFYLNIQWWSGGNMGGTTFFGDIHSYKAADAYSSLSMYSTSSSPPLSNDISCYFNSSTSYMSRGVAGVGSSIGVARAALTPNFEGNIWQSGGTNYIYPSPADNGLIFLPVVVRETSGSHLLRGQLPGLYYLLANAMSSLNTRDRLTGVTGLPGKVFRLMGAGPLSGGGISPVDVTGPWR